MRGKKSKYYIKLLLFCSVCIDLFVVFAQLRVTFQFSRMKAKYFQLRMPPDLVWRPKCPIVQRSSAVSGKPPRILWSSAPLRTGWQTTTGWMARCLQRSMLANCIFFPGKLIMMDFFFWHRTIKFCHPLKSGDYKLHLEAGKREETKTISVCVVGEHISFALVFFMLITFVQAFKNRFPKINTRLN